MAERNIQVLILSFKKNLFEFFKKKKDFSFFEKKSLFLRKVILIYNKVAMIYLLELIQRIFTNRELDCKTRDQFLKNFKPRIKEDFSGFCEKYFSAESEICRTVLIQIWEKLEFSNEQKTNFELISASKLVKRAINLENRISSVLLSNQEKDLNFYETKFTAFLTDYNSFLPEVIQTWHFRRSLLTLVLNSKFSTSLQIDLFLTLIFLDCYLAFFVGATTGIGDMLSLLNTKVMQLRVWESEDNQN